MALPRRFKKKRRNSTFILRVFHLFHKAQLREQGFFYYYYLKPLELELFLTSLKNIWFLRETVGTGHV